MQDFQTLATESTRFQRIKVTRDVPVEATSGAHGADAGCVYLFLDDEIQLTDVYGDFYHEALVHVPRIIRHVSCVKKRFIGLHINPISPDVYMICMVRCVLGTQPSIVRCC